jgi:site-specific DNA recombinase
MKILFAAIAAHDRKKNAEQSFSRTTARLKNGFWTFSASMACRYVKTPGGGNVLARDEPFAPIITEALEGFTLSYFTGLLRDL